MDCLAFDHNLILTHMMRLCSNIVEYQRSQILIHNLICLDLKF